MRMSIITNLGSIGAALLVAHAAFAQQPAAADKAAADALFTEARQLLDAGKPAEACPKLEESQRLDPASGTALNLGDCLERVGRTASAYVAFGDAVTLAKRSGDPTRAVEAERRMDALAPKLVRLAIHVPPPSRVQGLEVFRDGQPLAPTLWGTAIPVDPGAHVVEARAPNRTPWKGTIKLETPGMVLPLDVPTLDEMQRPPPKDKKAERITGIVMGGLGLATLGVAGGLAIAASVTDDDSKQYCLPEDPNKCYAKGVALRNDSIAYADAATLVSISGGLVLATGTALFLLARNPKPTNSTSHAWLVLPYASPSGAGLTFGSAW